MVFQVISGPPKICFPNFVSFFTPTQTLRMDFIFDSGQLSNNCSMPKKGFCMFLIENIFLASFLEAPRLRTLPQTGSKQEHCLFWPGFGEGAESRSFKKADQKYGFHQKHKKSYFRHTTNVTKLPRIKYKVHTKRLRGWKIKHKTWETDFPWSKLAWTRIARGSSSYRLDR